MLRGSSLRNTQCIYGVVVFTGHDTKVMRNSTSAKYKFSKLELVSNVCILVVLGFQILLSAIGAIIGTAWVSDNYQERVDKTMCASFVNHKCAPAYYLLLQDADQAPISLRFKFV